MKIKIDQICKIEGHADFIADIERGDVKSARFRTLEGTRLIESILIGRQYFEAPIITARICGICPVVHNLTAVKAIEACFHVTPTPAVVNLRKLMELAQLIHSHGLHLYFLSLPDFVGVHDGVTMVKKYPSQAQAALRIRSFGIRLVRIIGGRTIHPLTTWVGGIRRAPSKAELKKLLSNYDVLLHDALSLAELFKNLKYPELHRLTEYYSLSSPREYAIYDGSVTSSRGVRIPAARFIHRIEEVKRPYELIKQAKLNGKSYMVGAIARLNNNHRYLNPEAKKFLKGTSITWPTDNSFHNILAQSIELIHCLEESRKLIQVLLKTNFEKINKPFTVRAGKGVGAVEAPRGTLYHYYETDKNGTIVNCNIITPTVQLVPNLEEDLKVYLPNMMKLSEKVRVQKIRQLIRAYDPCMTCATH